MSPGTTGQHAPGRTNLDCPGRYSFAARAAVHLDEGDDTEA